MHQPKYPKSRINTASKPKILDEHTREKIRKHMSDINDVITEADIQNIEIDIFRPLPQNQKPKTA